MDSSFGIGSGEGERCCLPRPALWPLQQTRGPRCSLRALGEGQGWPCTVFEVLARRPMRIDGFSYWNECLGWGGSPLAQHNRTELTPGDCGSAAPPPHVWQYAVLPLGCLGLID